MSPPVHPTTQTGCRDSARHSCAGSARCSLPPTPTNAQTGSRPRFSRCWSWTRCPPTRASIRTVARLPLLSLFIAGGSENERKEPRSNAARGCRLSIALHPFARPGKGANNDGRQWTGLRPAPQPPASLSSRGGFGGQLLTYKVAFGLSAEGAPFARASEADRNNAPGYSWPPHLYQEKSSLGQPREKRQLNFKSLGFNNPLEFQRLQWLALGSDEELPRKRSVCRSPAQRFLRANLRRERIVVLF